MRCWIISILLVLMGSSYIHSQQASDKVSYEGQTVAVVDLVANPRISVDSLRPLVKQRTGEAYSGSKVESTIAALRATGCFTAVRVAVKPDSGGLHITFTLEPAFYFGVFDFPGASKGFPTHDCCKSSIFPPKRRTSKTSSPRRVIISAISLSRPVTFRLRYNRSRNSMKFTCSPPSYSISIWGKGRRWEMSKLRERTRPRRIAYCTRRVPFGPPRKALLLNLGRRTPRSVSNLPLRS